MIRCKPSHNAGELSDGRRACATDQNFSNFRSGSRRFSNRDGNLGVSSRTEAPGADARVPIRDNDGHRPTPAHISVRA